MTGSLDVYAGETKVINIARKIMALSRDELIAAMPYLDRVLLTMPVEYYVDDGKNPERAIGFGTDGNCIYAVPSVVLDIYMSGRYRMNRMLFHTMLHCLFTHMFASDKMDAQVWDLSTDIAVENVILELNLPVLTIDQDDLRRQVLIGIFTNTGYKNAESVYSWLISHPRQLKEAEKYAWLFRRDRHDMWRSGKEDKDRSYEESSQKEKWEKDLRQLDQSAQAYEKSRGLEPGTITRAFHLDKVKRENYQELLNRFVHQEEEMRLDLDSFDYVYYTYGLQLYRNMPLIEPLEYKVDKKIHDFVIAIDTSGSCEGRLVKGFLAKTYGILKSSSTFSEEMDVHIFQCDADIQEEVRITSQSAFDEYMESFSIKGMGGTDFRPVFDQVERELKEGEFNDLRGLIYFTDGRGTYPAYTPSFKTVVVFLEEEKDMPAVPPWAARIVMDEDEI